MAGLESKTCTFGDLLTVNETAVQVQYAQEAVRKGSPVVGVRGMDSVVIVSERKPLPRLFVRRTEKKIVKLDRHVALAYAGLRADARVLITRAQIECQVQRLTLEDPVSLEYITRYLAQMKQLYTQCSGRRPYGISCLVGGVDQDGTPRLFQTEPSGIFFEWKAAAMGRNDKAVRTYLEKNYNSKAVSTEEGAINLALNALLNHQPPDCPNSFEIAVMKHNEPVCLLNQQEVDTYVDLIQKQHKTANKNNK